VDDQPAPGAKGLPTRLTRFYGRQAETSELRGLVDRARLLTLVGAPGSGKTRLGIELAAGLAPEFPDGAMFVELAPLADPSLVPHAAAASAGIHGEASRPIEDTVVASMAGLRCLLVLDNCEHVVAAAAGLVARLLAECPGVRIVATSRVPIGVAGEQVWRVPALDAGTAAELFVDRARLAGATLAPDDASSPIVAEICARLEGLPLAIELAAAWTRVLSPAEIRDRLGDALPLLRGGQRGVDPRQATMEATVDWSCRLLAPRERRLFDRVSVFAGGFDLAAATDVAEAGDGNVGDGDARDGDARDGDDRDGDDRGGDVLAALSSLVDHSLVVAEPGGTAAGTTRYRLLEPVRQCGAVRLAAGGDEATVRRRHAERYLDVAVWCDAGLQGEGRAVALRRARRDEGNLLLAVEWARAHDPEMALRLCTALARFWELWGRVNEGRWRLEQMLDTGVGDRGLRATALARAGRLAWRQRDYGDARRMLEDSLAIKRDLGDEAGVGRRLCGLALVSLTEGDTDAAVRLCEQGIERFRAHGDDHWRAWALIFLGLARYVAGDGPLGDETLDEAMSLGRRNGEVAVTAYGLLYRCYGAYVAGDAPAERRHLVGALAAMRQAGGIVEEPDWLWAGTSLALTEGRVEAALRLAGGAEALSRRGGSHMNEQFVGHIVPRLERAVGDVGPEAADRLRAEGARMAFADLLAEATVEPPHRLTVREREVAELVALGLTNAQVAERLFISRRTVETHVEHVKQKLEVGTRAEVVAWVVRQTAVAGAQP
jgi:predicted ATPase/DNA-binding CsgD family transcriptional regulator